MDELSVSPQTRNLSNRHPNSLQEISGGKASPSVSILSRAPLCSNACRHCRSKPCDVATDHDDHICYNCEQRRLFPERIPKWEMQKLPICDLWCLECATQRCCTRSPHQHHLCMECERRGEELSSSPPRGARAPGLPMMTDWKSLEASCPIHTDSLCNGEWYILTVVVTC